MKFKPKNQTINILFLDGGVGDHVASLVTVNYIAKRYTWIKQLVWVPDYMVEFARHLLPGITIRGFSDMEKKYDQNLPTKTTKWDGHTSAMKIHTLDYAFLKLCDENPGIEYKNFLQINPIEIELQPHMVFRRNHVVITTGYTAKAREFKAEYINEIAKYILDKGYEPVFLGATKALTGGKHIIEGNFDKNIQFELGTNLVNRTTLLQAAYIMGTSAATIGVDNGLLHVAGCTDAPIIGGFPSVSPEIRMPVRNGILGWNYYPVVPDKGEGCNFCQETTNFLYGHDYRECIYNDDRSINAMKPEKFIHYLEGILK